MCSKEIFDYINRIIGTLLILWLENYRFIWLSLVKKYRNILKNTKYNRAIEVNGIVPLAAK